MHIIKRPLLVNTKLTFNEIFVPCRSSLLILPDLGLGHPSGCHQIPLHLSAQGMGPLSDLGLSLLPNLRPSLGHPSGSHQTTLHLLAPGMGPITDWSLSLLPDSRPLDSSLTVQPAPGLAGLCEGILVSGLAQHPPRRADSRIGHPSQGHLLLLDSPLPSRGENFSDLDQDSGLRSPGDVLDYPIHPEPARLDPMKADSSTTIRSSTRLQGLQPVSTLCKAMRRKARLLEGVTPGPEAKARKLTRKRVKSKSLLCGVDLTDAEASELRRFIRAGA